MNINLVANTIRGLSMDGVERAQSGHPGMPMGMADVAAVLFARHLKHNPSDPAWPDRDRFVLSAGHGSMLMYSLLHLSGYGLPIEQLMQFRQWDSLTPGHPEYGVTKGVETTTGPLGQGCGNAVGMALAEAMLAVRFNLEGHEIVNHRTFVFAGDGDMMEGLSHEAFSLAGHLGLSKLIVFYDSNKITIEGSTDLAYSDEVRKRFEGYNWNVLEIDGHDMDQIEKAFKALETEIRRPTLIITHTQIAHGAPHAHNTSEAHGAPLGANEIQATKLALGLPVDRDFYVPDEVRSGFAERSEELRKQHSAWKRRFKIWAEAHPALAEIWAMALAGKLPENMASQLPTFDLSKPMATRSASGAVMQSLAKAISFLVGGSADLAPSNNTYLKGMGDVGPGSFSGRNFHFGIREHAMVAALNGMSLHGGFRVFGATFMVFADYCRPAIRLAALMEQPVVYVLTHDSFFVGEDGPTHQPVEQAASLRAIPNVSVIRPADATETAAAWLCALRRTTGPTALLLTRHNLPVLDRSVFPPASEVEKGAYILWESKPDTQPFLIMMASGSEVSMTLEAAKQLAAENGKSIRVVSFPSWDLFEKQTRKYQRSVFPPACKRRLAVEAGITMGWEKYLGFKGHMIGLNRFGASAPCKVLAEKFGFTIENILATARALK